MSQKYKVSLPEKHITGAAAGGPLKSVHPEVVRVKCGILRPNIRSEMENQKYGKPMVQSWLIGKMSMWQTVSLRGQSEWGPSAGECFGPRGQDQISNSGHESEQCGSSLPEWL